MMEEVNNRRGFVLPMNHDLWWDAVIVEALEKVQLTITHLVLVKESCIVRDLKPCNYAGLL